MLLTALALTIRTPTRVPVQMCTPLEESLLNLLQPGSTPVQEEVAKITTALAASAGQDQPALSPLIEGEWVLLHTSKSTFDARNPLGRREDGTSPGLEGAFAVLSGGAQVAAPSSSPIQRALVDAFSVTQSITLQGSDKRVLQSVETPLGTLRLGARASVSSEQPRASPSPLTRATLPCAHHCSAWTDCRTRCRSACSARRRRAIWTRSTSRTRFASRSATRARNSYYEGRD